jgi:hypothetical protein
VYFSSVSFVRFRAMAHAAVLCGYSTSRRLRGDAYCSMLLLAVLAAQMTAATSTYPPTNPQQVHPPPAPGFMLRPSPRRPASPENHQVSTFRFHAQIQPPYRRLRARSQRSVCSPDRTLFTFLGCLIAADTAFPARLRTVHRDDPGFGADPPDLMSMGPAQWAYWTSTRLEAQIRGPYATQYRPDIPAEKKAFRALPPIQPPPSSLLYIICTDPALRGTALACRTTAAVTRQQSQT